MKFAYVTKPTPLSPEFILGCFSSTHGKYITRSCYLGKLFGFIVVHPFVKSSNIGLGQLIQLPWLMVYVTFCTCMQVTFAINFSWLPPVPLSCLDSFEKAFNECLGVGNMFRSAGQVQPWLIIWAMLNSRPNSEAEFIDLYSMLHS